MIKPVDLHRDLAGLPMLKERYGHPTDAESLELFPNKFIVRCKALVGQK